MAKAPHHPRFAASCGRAGISSVELAEYFLDRLERLGPAYNAVVTVLREPALPRRERDAELPRGRTAGRSTGFRTAPRISLAAEGAPPDVGRAGYRDHCCRATPRWSAGCARRRGALRQARHGRARGRHGLNQAFASFGPGRTPWDGPAGPEARRADRGRRSRRGWCRSPSGPKPGARSSSRRVLRRHRTPSHLGRVSRHGAMALSWTMDKLGPLARTAEDCGLVLAAVAGADPEDPSALPVASRRLHAATRRYRLGVLRGTLEGPSRRCAATSWRARGAREFCDVEDESRAPSLSLRGDGEHRDRRGVRIAFEPLPERRRITELAAPEDRVGGYAGQVLLADYLRALRLRRRRRRRWTSSSAGGRHRRAHPADRRLAHRRRPRQGVSGVPRRSDIAGAANLCGVPGLFLMNGTGEAGLPTSLQLTGRAQQRHIARDRHAVSVRTIFTASVPRDCDPARPLLIYSAVSPRVAFIPRSARDHLGTASLTRGARQGHLGGHRPLLRRAGRATTRPAHDGRLAAVVVPARGAGHRGGGAGDDRLHDRDLGSREGEGPSPLLDRDPAQSRGAQRGAGSALRGPRATVRRSWRRRSPASAHPSRSSAKPTSRCSPSWRS